MATCGKPVTWYLGGQSGPVEIPCGGSSLLTSAPATPCAEQHDFSDPAIAAVACPACLAERLDALEAKVRPLVEVFGVPVRTERRSPRAWLRRHLRRLAGRLDELAGTL